jgi:cell pole-organizing protein PopZ
MAAFFSSQTDLFSQLLMPLQGVVNFFSPPSPAVKPLANSAIGAAISAQPRLAKAPALPQHQRPAARSSIRPAGIRLVSQGLMGQIDSATSSLSATQILRSRRAQDGRIVISGRMRDVCAELDRLCEEPV